MVTDDRGYLERLANYVALVYHEARNVRHLIRARAIEAEAWKYLVALPVNRDEAWRALQATRLEAQRAKTARGLLLTFERRFRVPLIQLVELYGNPGWRNGAYGGNAWKRITELVQKLAACLESGRLSDADELFDSLGAERHNTGTIADKLSGLDEALRKKQTIEQRPGDL